MKRATAWLVWCLAVVRAAGAQTAGPDLLIADFEGQDYGGWKATGEAFGPGPARGTLPGQMEVSGYEGRGLVNSYYQGDKTTGTLTSPAFRIERRYLNFLIGGGMHPGKACINLLVDGKVVRTATGPNDRPGGTEHLDWHSWDVHDLAGREAMIQIVDQVTGGWGHINIDHIVQSDQKRGAAPAERQWTLQGRWLLLPVKNHARTTWMRLSVDGQTVREFEIELANDQPDLWVATDMGPWKGRTLKIEVDRLPFGSKGLERIGQSDAVPGGKSLYREALRPQFHFSPAWGWTNDPNGLVYYDGEYHLFFQHNPYGVKWGNMTWGHAVSRDLVHWQELGDAIHPDALGTIFSGSAVVDHHNTAGLQTGKEKPIVCIYTSAGGTNRASAGQPFAQSIAYSNDRGRTWTKYPGNPVLKHVAGSNRDPKVFWHQPSRQWVMALYLDGPQYALFASPDLKRWARLSDIPEVGGTECPDLFELAVDGDKANTRWVFWAGNGNYLVGRFDGKSFTKESGPHPSKYGANDYAAQTFSDIPAEDGRRIQLSWMSGGNYPGMPFNQQMTVPRVLTLRTTAAGIRLFMEPVKELEQLRGKKHAWKDLALAPGDDPLAKVPGELFDVLAEIDPGGAKQVTFEFRGAKVEYFPASKRLVALGREATLEPEAGKITLRLLVDRTSVEVFANGGRVQMASCFLPERPKGLSLRAAGGTAKVLSLGVWEMRSIWPSR
jgi:fructan beta-fructosidase